MGSARHVPVAIAHDYLTQAGGAERVVLDLARTFPDAPIYTSLYHASGTFPEYAMHNIRASALNRIPLLRNDHRLALPLLAPAVSRMTIPADVTIASSSGWAHGFHTTGRKVVYCHAPARWLYQTARYLGNGDGQPAKDRYRRTLAQIAVKALGGPLRRWDRKAAFSADRYLVNSTAVRAAVKEVYGIDAEIIPPPPAMDPDGAAHEIDGLQPGFVLCVARLLPYKNVDMVIAAMQELPDHQLVVVGDGPDLRRLADLAEHLGGSIQPDGTTRGRIALLGRVSDDQLRWLYSRASMLVAASFEDYGLTPLEAAMFGKPTVALRAGGYLDTVAEGTSGVFFDVLTPAAIADAVAETDDFDWEPAEILVHADRFSPKRFQRRIHAAVDGLTQNEVPDKSSPQGSTEANDAGALS